MAMTLQGYVLIATKQADGSVNFQFQSPNGGVRFFANLPAADVTSINTNVNGGSAGATRTFTYGQVSSGSNVPHDIFERD